MDIRSGNITPKFLSDSAGAGTARGHGYPYSIRYRPIQSVISKGSQKVFACGSVCPVEFIGRRVVPEKSAAIAFKIYPLNIVFVITHGRLQQNRSSGKKAFTIFRRGE